MAESLIIFGLQASLIFFAAAPASLMYFTLLRIVPEKGYQKSAEIMLHCEFNKITYPKLKITSLCSVSQSSLSTTKETCTFHCIFTTETVREQ